MHAAPVFSVDDEDVISNHVAQHPFAMLAVNAEGGPLVAMLPMVLDRASGTLIGHVSRANAIVDVLKSPVAAVAIFQGPQAYVSPGWYPSKAEHGKAVPTWNYIAVEARGELTITTDPAQMSDFLEPLTAHMEAERDHPWQVSDAPERYIEGLSRGIVGLTLKVASMRGVRKLSQNKLSADFDGVREGLLREPSADAHAISNEMSNMGTR